MPIKIEITGDTPEEVRSLMAGLLGSTAIITETLTLPEAATTAPEEPKVEEPKAEEPKTTRTRKKAEEPKPDPTPDADATPAADPEPDTSPQDTAGSATSAEEPTVELDYDKDIVPKVVAVSQAFGRKGVAELLGKYGVDNARNVPVERRQELLADAEAMLKGA